MKKYLTLMFIIHLFTYSNILSIEFYGIVRHTKSKIADWLINVAYLLRDQKYRRAPLSHADREASYPYISGDTFRALCDFIIDETAIPFDPNDVKDGDIIFVRSSYIEYFFNSFHPYIKSRYILVTHKGTSSVPRICAQYLDDDTLIAWFGKNVVINHPKLFPIPIGIKDSGNTNILNKIITKLPIKKDKLLYMNFATWTNPGARSEVEQLFAHKSFCYKAKRKSLPSYLQDLASSKFVLSPTGKGLDCYRTWEALLMGSIPIVKRSTIDSLFKGLPVVIVNDWKEVTEEFLEKKYKEIASKTYNRDKLYVDYWFNKINQCKDKARSMKS